MLALLAQARLEAGDARGAHDDLVEASGTAPRDGLVRRVFAAYDVDAGDFDGALRELNARLARQPRRHVRAAFQRGRVWLYKDEPHLACDDFIRADDKPAFLYPALWAFSPRRGCIWRRAGAFAQAPRRRADRWPAPVARMFMGDIGFEAARAAAA